MQTITPMPASPLDTISKQLTHIDQRLSDIEDKVVLDDWFKVLLILVPILVGILTFILTRNKEVRFKKAEIGGEIFMRIHELKKLRVDYFHAFINKCAYNAASDLVNNEQRDEEFLRHTYGIIDYEEPEKIAKRIEHIGQELAKYIGQFRFYLPKKESKQLNNMSFVVQTHHVAYEFFDDCKTQKDIFDKHEKLFLNKIFSDDQEKKISELFTKIEELLVK